MRSLKLLFKNLDTLKAQFLYISIVSILDGFASFLIPVVLAKVSPTATLQDAPKWIALLFALYFLSIGLQWVLRRHAEAMGPKFVLRLKRRYFEALERMPVQKLLQVHSAYILSLISRVADGLGGILVRVLWGWLRSLIALSLFLYFTYQESLALALANIIIILIFVAVSTSLSRKMVPLASELNTRYAKLYEVFADFAANVSTVKRLGIRPFADDILNRSGRHAEAQIEVVQSAHARRWFLLHALYGTAFLSTVSILFYRSLSGQSSPAVLILFIAAFATLRIHAEGVSEDIKALIELDGFIETLDSVCPLVVPTSMEVATEVFNKLELRDIKFSYAGREQIISVPNLSISRGEQVLITGESGEGKSTVLGLVAGLLQPHAGQIKFNEQNISGAAYPSALFAIASQESELFSMSILDNICLGLIVDEEHLRECLDELRLSDWIAELPQGLDSQVGERGMRVSSGQKQRINLLRAYFLNRDIYLLDEPTSHLDPETEQAVVAFIAKRLAGKSLVVVSHRPAFSGLNMRGYRMMSGVLQQA